MEAVVSLELPAEQLAGADALLVELLRLLASAIRPAVFTVSFAFFLPGQLLIGRRRNLHVGPAARVVAFAWRDGDGL